MITCNIVDHNHNTITNISAFGQYILDFIDGNPVFAFLFPSKLYLLSSLLLPHCPPSVGYNSSLTL